MFRTLLLASVCVSCTALPTGFVQQTIELPTSDPRGSKFVVCGDKLVMANPYTDTVSTLIYTQPYWDNLVITTTGIWGFGSVLACDTATENLLMGNFNTVANGAGEIRRYEWTGTNWRQDGSGIFGHSFGGTDYPFEETGWGKHVWTIGEKTVVAAPLASVPAVGISAGSLYVYDGYNMQQRPIPAPGPDATEYGQFGQFAVGAISSTFFVMLDKGVLYSYMLRGGNSGEMVLHQSFQPPLVGDLTVNKRVAISPTADLMVISDGNGGSGDATGMLLAYTKASANSGWTLAGTLENPEVATCPKCMFGSGHLSITDSTSVVIGSPNMNDGDGAVHTAVWTGSTWGNVRKFQTTESGVGRMVASSTDVNNDPIILGLSATKMYSYHVHGSALINPPTLPPVATISPTPPPVPTTEPTASPFTDATAQPTGSPVTAPPGTIPTPFPTRQPAPSTPTTPAPTAVSPGAAVSIGAASVAAVGIMGIVFWRQMKS